MAIEFDEDLAPTEQDVYIGKGEKRKHYILRSASVDAVVQYRNIISSNATLNTSTNNVTPGAVAMAQPTAVAACLYLKFDPNREPRKVTITEVLTWPGHLVDKLFIELQKMSPGLQLPSEKEHKAEAEAAKNEQGAGTDSSS